MPIQRGSGLVASLALYMVCPILLISVPANQKPPLQTQHSSDKSNKAVTNDELCKYSHIHGLSGDIGGKKTQQMLGNIQFKATFLHLSCTIQYLDS